MIAICRVKDADLEAGLMGCCWMLRRLHWLTLVFDSPEPNDAGVVVVVEALSAPQSYRLTNALCRAAELPSCRAVSNLGVVVQIHRTERI